MSRDNLAATDAAPVVKKRFVWPEDLHMEMIGAVFESGLKCLEDGCYHDFSWNLSHKDIPVTKINAFLAKVILYRNYHLKGKSYAGTGKSITNSTGNSSSDLEQHSMIKLESMDSFGSIDFSQKKEVSDSIDHNTRAMLDDINRQKRKLDVMEKALASQNFYLKRVKNKVSQQTKLINQISREVDTFNKNAMAKLSSFKTIQMKQNINGPLDELSFGLVVDNDLPTIATYDKGVLSTSTNSSPREKGIKSGGTPSSTLSYRNELQMISEMRANINVHKQLMAQKQQQISAYMNDTRASTETLGGDTSNNVALVNTSFSSTEHTEQQDNEMLDTELFAFLLDDNTGDGT